MIWVSICCRSRGVLCTGLCLHVEGMHSGQAAPFLLQVHCGEAGQPFSVPSAPENLFAVNVFVRVPPRGVRTPADNIEGLPVRDDPQGRCREEWAKGTIPMRTRKPSSWMARPRLSACGIKSSGSSNVRAAFFSSFVLPLSESRFSRRRKQDCHARLVLPMFL